MFCVCMWKKMFLVLDLIRMYIFDNGHERFLVLVRPYRLSWVGYDNFVDERTKIKGGKRTSKMSI